jgi:hypothetical protein
VRFADALLAYVGVGVLAAAIAGLVWRRRHRLCLSFFVFLWTVLIPDVLALLWPKPFYTRWFWALKETAQTALMIAVSLEMAYLAFGAFPRARVRVVALLAVLGGLTALVLNLQPPSLIDPYDEWLGRLTPICYAGIVWLYVSIFLVAAYYRVPVHPFHRVVILGFVLFLTVSTGALGTLGEAGKEVYSTFKPLGPAALVATEGLWAWAAWRRLPAPESTELMRQLQPWARW